MDPAAFAALVERCAPTTAMVRPLTAIVRQASSFEPLLITIEGRKPIPIQATDRNEAIQLVTEAIATGQPVRTGLAQLDAEDMKAGRADSYHDLRRLQAHRGPWQIVRGPIASSKRERVRPRSGNCQRCRELRGQSFRHNARAPYPADGPSVPTFHRRRADNQHASTLCQGASELGRLSLGPWHVSLCL